MKPILLLLLLVIPIVLFGQLEAPPTGTAAGVHTGVPSLPSNITALVVSEGQYIRVGNTVTYSTRFTCQQTAGSATSFRLTPPVASNFGAEEDAAGVCTGTGTNSVYGNVMADAAADLLHVRFAATVTANLTWTLTVTYQVIP